VQAAGVDSALVAVGGPVGVGVQQPVVDGLAEPAEPHGGGVIDQQGLVAVEQFGRVGLAGPVEEADVGVADVTGRPGLLD